ncbi:hypothetical protein [Microvirga guangxiensis]|uniref:Uncharacterized protein n=1 Tax=Microvirga guangxiensis TaxID=549386 RepID=A0A1G5LJY4_9HYPH|nr:hypothetical protein [Microvirga guangxiensis]SCZ12771.1 hypothetical protein SAMN02927923_04378 [Microvirga guangxiensis]
MLAQKPEPTQHHPVGHYGTSDLKDDFPRGIKQKAENSTSVWGPRLQAASDRVSNTSERVKVWAQEERKVDMSANVRKAVNPIYILAAVTLGIPALLLILLIGLNPGVLEGSLTAVATFLVISAFITAAVFEIKRLADQSSDEEHY